MQSHDVITNFVSEIYRADGRRIWIFENARAVRDWAGVLLCYEGKVEDVTEKFEQDRALRVALRRAQTANRVKAAFLAAMSHELKMPLNDVLDVTRLQSGSPVLEERSDAPQEIVEEAIGLARKATGDMREIGLSLPQETPVLHGDPHRIAQALGNLLANALKFTPTQGEGAWR